jgi:anti-anti-sigma factor
METRFERVEEAGVAILTVNGPVGLDLFEDFRQQLEGLIEGCRGAAVLDLEACNFLASRVFPLIVKADEVLKGDEKRLLLACNSDLRRILEVLHLDKYLELHASRSRCLEAARAVA